MRAVWMIARESRGATNSCFHCRLAECKYKFCNQQWSTHIRTSISPFFYTKKKKLINILWASPSQLVHLVAHIYAKLIESSCWCAIDASPHRPTIISLTQLNSHRIHRNVWRAKRNVQTRFPSNYQKYELKLNYSESFTLHSRTKILHWKHSPHMILIYMFHIVTKKTNINFITLYCYLINSLSLSLLPGANPLHKQS